jgi:hypothetical protein
MITTMPRRFGRLGAVLAGLGLVTLLGYGVAAQGTATPAIVAAVPATDLARPVTVNRGICPRPGSAVVSNLGNAEPWGGVIDMTTVPPPVIALEQTVNMTLDDLARNQTDRFTIVVHASVDHLDRLAACGDIQGPIVHGRLAIALRPIDNSDVSGVAVLARQKRGFLDLAGSDTRITVYLVTSATGAAPVTASR